MSDSREVLLVSSHTVVVDKTVGGVGIRVGMSHLVANIMETTHHLCKLAVPPQVVSSLSDLEGRGSNNVNVCKGWILTIKYRQLSNMS